VTDGLMLSSSGPSSRPPQRGYAAAVMSDVDGSALAGLIEEPDPAPSI
jgi:hypothetical protein